MKYRDEPESYNSPVMLLGETWEPERDEKIAKAIAESLKKNWTERAMPEAVQPKGRVQFVAIIELMICPEFGMPQSGHYTRVAGEFEMPIAKAKKDATGG